MKILIVDDEMSPHVALIDQLEKMGVMVIKAFDGKMGLEFFKKENPNLVITDTNMPEMNGPQLAEKILELNPEAIIISCSNNLRPNLKFPNGVPFLPKPITLPQIEDVLKKMSG